MPKAVPMRARQQTISTLQDQLEALGCDNIDIETLNPPADLAESMTFPQVSPNGRIKRPQNSFLLFRNHIKDVLDGRTPKNQHDFSTIVSNIWKKMPSQARRLWALEAEAVAKEHRKAYPSYSYAEEKAKTRGAKAVADAAKAGWHSSASSSPQALSSLGDPGMIRFVHHYNHPSSTQWQTSFSASSDTHQVSIGTHVVPMIYDFNNYLMSSTSPPEMISGPSGSQLQAYHGDVNETPLNSQHSYDDNLGQLGDLIEQSEFLAPQATSQTDSYPPPAGSMEGMPRLNFDAVGTIEPEVAGTLPSFFDHKASPMLSDAISSTTDYPDTAEGSLDDPTPSLETENEDLIVDLMGCDSISQVLELLFSNRNSL
ncbi:hypothetical protein BJ165DRAFT_1608161 [Panaeolus papilionaceus]|nr:hypothetical protein BJ165DRAFT_1608161 [Panaeolus papilionaceus]